MNLDVDSILQKNYGPLLPDDKTIKILDFGCGRGRMLQFLTATGYTNVIGIDPDPSAISNAKAVGKHACQYVKDPIQYLNENQNSFDVLIAKDVIYYYEKKQLPDLAKGFFRALKPGGRLIVEVFNGAQLTAQYTMAKDLGILCLLTEQSLFDFFKLADFKKIEIRPQIPTKRGFFYLIQKLGICFLRWIYFYERGLDANNPKIFSKSIIGFGERV